MGKRIKSNKLRLRDMFLIECAHAAAAVVVVGGELLIATGLIYAIRGLVDLFS